MSALNAGDFEVILESFPNFASEIERGFSHYLHMVNYDHGCDSKGSSHIALQQNEHGELVDVPAPASGAAEGTCSLPPSSHDNAPKQEGSIRPGLAAHHSTLHASTEPGLLTRSLPQLPSLSNIGINVQPSDRPRPRSASPGEAKQNAEPGPSPLESPGSDSGRGRRPRRLSFQGATPSFVLSPRLTKQGSQTNQRTLLAPQGSSLTKQGSSLTKQGSSRAPWMRGTAVSGRSGVFTSQTSPKSIALNLSSKADVLPYVHGAASYAGQRPPNPSMPWKQTNVVSSRCSVISCSEAPRSRRGSNRVKSCGEGAVSHRLSLIPRHCSLNGPFVRRIVQISLWQQSIQATVDSLQSSLSVHQASLARQSDHTASLASQVCTPLCVRG